MILDSETNRLVQVGWKYSEEVNGDLCVGTGGGTTTRVLRTFAGRWVTLGEAGGPEEKKTAYFFHLWSDIWQTFHNAAKVLF